jgi:hypothetical protein
VKSLLEIQQEIRKLESSVQSIGESIKDINSDIDSIRNESQKTDIDFNKIKILAKQIRLGEHPIKKLGEDRVCRIYMEMLLHIVRLDPDQKKTIDRLVFMQWLQSQSEIEWTLEELYTECFKIDKQSYDELLEEIPQKYREIFFVDALMVANITGSANLEIQEYLADLAVILEIPREKILILAVIAKMALCQSATEINREQFEMVQADIAAYRHYISPEMVEQGKNAWRKIVVEIPESEVISFNWIAKQRQKVNIGDEIAGYMKIKHSEGSGGGSRPFWLNTTTMHFDLKKATSEGTLFQFESNETYYGVISYETDDIEDLKAWVDQRKS